MDRTNFEKILHEVKNYHRDADGLFAEYYKKVDQMRKELRDDVFQQKIKDDVYPYYSGTLMGCQTVAKSNIHAICESIKDDLKSWTLKPIRPETMQILSCINDFNIRLTKDELSILEADVKGNMFAGKIFTEIAKNNGYRVQMPDVTAYLKALRTAESDACVAIDAYCGSSPDFIGRDLLDKRRFNGSPIGEWEVWYRIYAAEYAEKHNSLDEAAGMWEQSKVSIAYTLTEKERARLKDIIDDIGKLDGTEKTEKIKRLLGSDSDINDKLQLMGDDYKEIAAQYMVVGQQEASYIK